MADGVPITISGVSCAFAQNMVRAWDSQKTDANGMYQAFSPATGRTYEFQCMNNSNGQFCGGGNLANDGKISWR